MLKPSQTTNGKDSGSDSATLAALKCAYQLMQQRIISNPNDMMGILLFGTEKSKFGHDSNPKDPPAYPHCYLLTDLDIPAASDVKMLRDLVQDEKESSILLTPSTESVSMANVLFCANQIFTTKAPNFSSRRLFLVTDNDNPHPHQNDKTLSSAAAVRAKDLFDLGVLIELFPISHSDRGFDKSVFYDDIVYRGLPSDSDAPAPVSTITKTSSTGDGISLLQSLLSSINSKAVPKRALFSLPFEVGPGLKIGVKGYILIKRQTIAKACYVWVGGEKVQIAIGSTSTIVEETTKTVDKSEIRKAYTFGGERIAFTEEESKALNYFGDPTIRIIGFKSMNLLPIWATHRPPIFVYPSETDYVGSTRVFSALQQKLLASEKFALAWFIARRNAKPVLAALIPGAENIDDMDEQSIPPGLWAIPLPFADDIRNDPESELIKAPVELVDMMKTIVQQLQLPKGLFDPNKYPNPCKFTAGL
jgi:ATP-dependent DNA helicase 2 subunit 1